MLKEFLESLKTALVLFLILTALTGVIYPLLVAAVAQFIFPWQANGSLIHRDGQVIGSALIGQYFTDNKYFWGRPSATSPFPYNAALSSGSNLGPLNPNLTNAIKNRSLALKKADPTNQQPIPVDLLTASGSGLDPEISPAAALYQVSRVAQARGLEINEVRSLVLKTVEERYFGLLGMPRINVLALNLALDDLQKRKR